MINLLKFILRCLNCALLLFSALVPLICCVFLFTAVFLAEISFELPEIDAFSSYSPPVTTKIYSADCNKIAEISKEKRILVRYIDIPQRIIDAFVAAEDKNFFVHSGFNIYSIFRATTQSAINLLKRRRVIGASTITQQIVRALLLNDKREMSRKISEMILAYRVTAHFTKEEIMEIYLNHIFLGSNSYGIVAAARTYFDKPIEQLSIGEAAVLAALPKAPSALNPFTNKAGIVNRRNLIMKRMRENDFISEIEFKTEVFAPLRLNDKKSTLRGEQSGFYYIEEVKKELVHLFGKQMVYDGGLSVFTHMNEGVQSIADKILKKALKKYDKSQGWRGVITNVAVRRAASIYSQLDGASVAVSLNIEAFKHLRKPAAAENVHELALVTNIKKDSAEILLQSGESKELTFRSFSKFVGIALINKERVDIEDMRRVMKRGDVVLIDRKSESDEILIEQVPDVNGAIVIMEPYTFNVLAIIGGYSANDSEFNRATMANRQVGSLFKPFIYLRALQSGFSKDTMISDSPISIDMSKHGGGIWMPKNYDNKYLGDISMTTALRRSRNTPTVRVVLALGVNKVMEFARNFEIYNDKYGSHEYSVALGSFSSTLMKMTRAYNVLASEGYTDDKKLIAAVYDRHGNLIYSDKSIRCTGCIYDLKKSDIIEPTFTKMSKKIISDRERRDLEEMLLSKNFSNGGDIIKKTGTTNNSNDAWCVGYTRNFTAGVYVGFDSPRSLGKNAYGANIALPVIRDFFDGIAMNADLLRGDGIDGLGSKKYIDIKSEMKSLSLFNTSLQRIISEDKGEKYDTNAIDKYSAKFADEDGVLRVFD